MDKLLATRPNKKILQSHIIKSTGKNVTLRDITNRVCKLSSKPESLENMLEELRSPGNLSMPTRTST